MPAQQYVVQAFYIGDRYPQVYNRDTLGTAFETYKHLVASRKVQKARLLVVLQDSDDKQEESNANRKA